MPRTLFLHCGPAKTGTSAIQARLRDAPPAGICYPATGQWPDGAHHMPLFAMRGKTSRGAIQIPPFDTLMTALCAELDAAETDVVISSEAVSTADIGTFLDHLQAGLSRPFDRVQAIVVLRHPLERAASAYNQNVKDMAVTRVAMPKTYLETQARNLCLMPLIQAWQTVPVPVEFLNYHPAATLVDRFLAAIGCARSGDAETQQTHNRSINGYGLVTLLAGRMAGLDQSELTGLFRDLRADKTRSIWQGPSFPFAQNAVRSFLETVVAPDLAEVERTIGMTFPDKSRDLPRRVQLSPDDARSIRERLSGLGLDASQSARADRVIDAFTMQKRRTGDRT